MIVIGNMSPKCVSDRRCLIQKVCILISNDFHDVLSSNVLFPFFSASPTAWRSDGSGR